MDLYLICQAVLLINFNKVLLYCNHMGAKPNLLITYSVAVI